MDAKTMIFPSPVGGLNARDSFDNMPPNDAVQMVNFFPETTYVRARGPDYVIGKVPLVGSVDGIVPFESTYVKYLLVVVETYYAVAYANVSQPGYNNTNPGVPALTVGEQIGGGHLTAGVPIQTLMYSNAGGPVTLIFNGADPPLYWNGLAAGFQQCGFSQDTSNGQASVGFNPNALSMGCVYANRIFMPELGTMFVWYPSTAQAYQGACQYLDLGPYTTRGGGVTDVCAWTYTSSLGGIYQVLACITSEGEVVIFNGTDPTNASDWNMVGQYAVGRPTSGSRATVPLGPDALFLSEDGVQPFQAYLQGGKDKAAGNAISQKINNLFAQAILESRSINGWQCVVFPAKHIGLINVPTAGTQGGNATTTVQYVWNLLTGAWAQWDTFYPTQNWIVFDGRLIYAANIPGQNDAFLFQADLSRTELAALSNPTLFNAATPPFLQTAFQYPNGDPQHHFFTMAQPTLASNVSITADISVVTDFQMASGPAVADQNIPFETGNAMVQTPWVGVAAYGMPASVAITVSAASFQTQLYNTKVIYQEGGIV